jgi:cysteine desulfurase
MGFPLHRTQNAIRFSLGAANTAAEIDHVIAILPPVVERLRKVTAACVSS